MTSAQPPMSAEELARSLSCGELGCPCGRPTGSGWMSHCPAHDDRHPSLSITDSDGRLLVHCHAGCSQEAVINALRERGLWPNGSTLGSRPTEYRGEAILRWYDYRDIDGSTVCAVGRTPSKQFPVIRPDGRGGWSWGLGELRGQRRPLYRLRELLNADPKRTVLIMEGEKDADRLADLGLVATTNLGGAGKWHLTDQEPLRDRVVVVISDNDDAGQRHAQEIARSLRGIARAVVALGPLPHTGPGGDASDFLDAGGTVEELQTIARETWKLRGAPVKDSKSHPSGETVPSAAVDTGEGPVLIWLSEVEPEQVSWQWEPYIPLGKITIVAGDPGLGKSWLTLAIATAATNGIDLGEVIKPNTAAVLPTGVKREPANVLILTAEDGLADTVRPRLDAMGAAVERVWALKAIRDATGQEHHPSLVHDLAHLEAVLAEGGFRLVIIDPLNAYLGADLDTHRDAAIRAVLTPLGTLAERYGVAVICVLHLTKGGRDRPIYRPQGGIGYVAAARVVLLVGQDPDNDRERALVPVKNNLAPMPSAVAFEIDDGRFLWKGETSVTADAVLGPRGGDEDPSELDEAIAFLKQSLADGPVKVKELLREASDAGISPTTLKRAKKALGVEACHRQEGFGGAKGHWEWCLPSQSTQEDQVLQHDPVAPLCEIEPDISLNQGAHDPLVSDSSEGDTGGGRTCWLCGGPNDNSGIPFPYCSRCWRKVLNRMNRNGE